MIQFFTKLFMNTLILKSKKINNMSRSFLSTWTHKTRIRSTYDHVKKKPNFTKKLSTPIISITKDIVEQWNDNSRLGKHKDLVPLTHKTESSSIYDHLKTNPNFTKKLFTPIRFTKSIIGQWKYNRRWRKRKGILELTPREFLTLPQAIVRRWFFWKKRKLSGKIRKKRLWTPFVQWTSYQKKRFGAKKWTKIAFRKKWLQKHRRRFKFTSQILEGLTDSRRIHLIFERIKTGYNDIWFIGKRWPKNKNRRKTLKLKNLKKWGKTKPRKFYPAGIFKIKAWGLLSTPINKFKPIKQRKTPTIVSPTLTKIDNRKWTELDYILFPESPNYLTVDKPLTYNTFFEATNTIDEDLPIFALDLYNLYLHNLENSRPVPLEQWITRTFRKKTNKKYKKLLVEYTALLKSFYLQVAAAKLKKKTPASNAILLIRQFSRVAGARTTCFLNKRHRFLPVATVRFFLRHKHFKKFWRTKKSLVKMKVIMSRMLLWLYNTPNSKHLLGVKLRQAFFQNYETDKRFIYKKHIKLHFKKFKNPLVKISSQSRAFL